MNFNGASVGTVVFGASAQLQARDVSRDVEALVACVLRSVRSVSEQQENLRVSQLIADKLVVSVGGIRSVKRGEVDGGAFKPGNIAR